ncbi:pyocin knob domain-containing protein [Pectobacterium brasiliense]|uniref:pyocin knob domain-containing protein n=1 Tax=Pectobacterium brasiliense TaxID=180957 RepID=UPI0030171957
MSWYKTGSITATSGSKIITGNGTQFSNPLNGVSAGRMLLLPGAGTVQVYEIESVQSNTQLTLVSAFSGTTGSGKPYAIPTSPTVSIEQFAHEFASTLAYYQQQLQGWQSILTGSGNITLTTPDGQAVTVRSQAEWDRLLNGKSNLSQTLIKRGALGTVDLNTITGTSDGIWEQNLNANATTARNYPITVGGVLTVVTSKAVNANSCIQTYEPYNSVRKYNRWFDGTVWGAWAELATLDTVQTITAEKVFSVGMRDERSTYGRTTSPLPVLLSSIAQLNNMRIGDVLFMNCAGSLPALVPQTSGYFHIYCVGKADNTAGGGSFIACQLGIAHNMFNGSLSGGSSITWRRALYTGFNAVADSSGFWKTASPVINIYSDGSFTTTDEADGVNVERLSEGVYKITGCQGMHPDAVWNGIDGGVSNPKCRNDKALLWNTYEVHEDGSVTVYTFHRVHADAMPFAQNRLTLDKEPFDPEKGHTPDIEWPNQTPIDVPRGLFIQVRVNMPERDGEINPVSDPL